LCEDGSCGVIRFKSDGSSSAIIPSGGTYDEYIYPFTATGLTSGKNGRLGFPEWKLNSFVEPNNEAELWEVYNDGSEILRAVFNEKENKFILIK
jgi:hypothetical protein